MLNLFNLIMRLAWGTNGQQKVDIIQLFLALAWGTNGQKKVLLSAPEVESFQSELAYMEEKEAHLESRLEHIDETLRSSHFSGYLQMRTRWTALPGELVLPLDDIEVDDWLPCFVVIQGPYIFLYYKSTDTSPYDSTLLSDVVEIGRMPSHPQKEGETRYYFYLVTRQGLRYECASASKLQVDAWLTALQEECKQGFDSTP